MQKKISLLIVVFAMFLISTSFYMTKNPILYETDFSFFPVDLTKEYKIEITEKELFYEPSRKGYLYGPSIIKEDEKYNVWFSSPGNNSTQWDYITYFSGNFRDWGLREVVLKPTKKSFDMCSVCDPGVIYFNGYYYLAYTSTNDVLREGMNNQAFVARSAYPNGPFEKWNGEGWGGDPYPIIEYSGNPDHWGIGEVSFVIFENRLYIYYTYIAENEMVTNLSIADLIEDWPSTMKFYGTVNERNYSDSLDVVYDDNLEKFLGIAVGNRMDKDSEIVLYVSDNGKDFHQEASASIEDYSHNIGIEKDKNGHVNSSNELLIGYAYGEEWGKWNTNFAKIKILEY